PGDRLPLELRERNHRVDQAHLERLLGVVEAGGEQNLLSLLFAAVVRGGGETKLPSPFCRRRWGRAATSRSRRRSCPPAAPSGRRPRCPLRSSGHRPGGGCGRPRPRSPPPSPPPGL